MIELFHIVPWYNSGEWHDVYNKIYSPSLSDKEEALNHLLIWKARCPSVPSGIESTLTLLQVHIQDLKNGENVANDQLLRLAYSSAIMRFVNHMLDTQTAKGASLYIAAKRLGVPDWIIDLRHDTAHSNNLPSITLLRDATQIGLSWLQSNYWGKYVKHIQDYISGVKVTQNKNEHKIAALMHLCISISIISRSKIKTLAQIPNPNMRTSIATDLQDLFGGAVDLSNFKCVTIKEITNVLYLNSKRLLIGANTSVLVNNALLGEDSLFLSFKLMDFLVDKEKQKKKRLDMEYAQYFEVLLSFLHTNDLLLDFIMALIKITQDTSKDYHHRAKYAALWVSEILKALKKSKNFIDRINMVNAKDMSTKKRKEVNQLYYHWFPNERFRGILLDLRKEVPMELLDIDFIQPIISKYNQYLVYFVGSLLDLVEPALPVSVIKQICNLATLIATPKKFPVTTLPSKIYTVDDLKEDSDGDILIVNSDNDESSTEKTYSIERAVDDNSIWKLASQEYDWSTCPIGQLPWQQNKTQSEKMDVSS